jgi:hypothetical protein
MRNLLIRKGRLGWVACVLIIFLESLIWRASSSVRAGEGSGDPQPISDNNNQICVNLCAHTAATTCAYSTTCQLNADCFANNYGYQTDKTVYKCATSQGSNCKPLKPPSTQVVDCGPGVFCFCFKPKHRCVELVARRSSTGTSTCTP